MTPQKTTVDWFRFRSQAEPMEILEAMKPMYGQGRLLGQSLRLVHQDRAILGFKSSAAICFEDIQVGRMDYGGESQLGWVRVDIPGKGCEWVSDWDQVGALEDAGAQIRRLDLALTTWKGEVTHEQVVSAHAAGRFTTRGRPPHLQQHISTDPRAGRTCYIGKREKSDKFMRCYEKGFEMVGKMGRMPGMCTEIDGCRVEDIYRAEVEFKASSTDIPWEVIERRDQYFAGAYPFCADILPNVECDILKRRPERAPQTDLAVALENCRIQFGPTLFTALMAYHGDMTTVWDKVIGREHNQALVEAGVLMVEHE